MYAYRRTAESDNSKYSRFYSVVLRIFLNASSCLTSLPSPPCLRSRVQCGLLHIVHGLKGSKTKPPNSACTSAICSRCSVLNTRVLTCRRWRAVRGALLATWRDLVLESRGSRQQPASSQSFNSSLADEDRGVGRAGRFGSETADPRCVERIPASFVQVRSLGLGSHGYVFQGVGYHFDFHCLRLRFLQLESGAQVRRW